MSEGIDLSKLPLVDVCLFCSKAKMHVKPYKDKIKPGQYLLDLIYSNVFGPYIPSCFGVKYYVTFFDNYDKTLEVILLSSKDGVLAAYDLF